jgi:tetratricopeptide (TPR) repeat protein
MFRYIWAHFVYTWGGLHRYFGLKNNVRSEHEAAVRYFNRAYHIDKNFRRARLERSILLWRELGRLDEAIAEFDALLSEDPHYSPALLNRALAAQEGGRYESALADLEAYLRLPPDEYHREAARMATLLREIVQARPE